MTFFLLFLTIISLLSAATVVLMLRDGRGPVFRTPPTSHAVDPTFLPPGARV